MAGANGFAIVGAAGENGDAVPPEITGVPVGELEKFVVFDGFTAYALGLILPAASKYGFGPIPSIAERCACSPPLTYCSSCWIS